MSQRDKVARRFIERVVSNQSERPIRSEPEFRESARFYIEEQLAVMRKYGHERILSVDEYYRLEDELVAVAKKLWTSSGGEIA